MDHVWALLIFLTVAAVIWFLGVSAFRFLGGPDLKQEKDFWANSLVPILFVGFTGFVPYPASYLINLVWWWVGGYGLFQLPFLKSLGLLVILAALDMIWRFFLLGLLQL